MEKHRGAIRIPRRYRRNVAAGVAATLVIAIGGYLRAAIVTRDLTVAGQSPAVLAATIAGVGVSISNIQFRGDSRAAATFTDDSGAVGISAGILLSTGRASSVVGPNRRDNTSTDLAAPGDSVPRAEQNGCEDPAHQNKKTLGLPGDTDLNQLSGFTTCDATVLELDFVPNKDRVFFNYVFASEEYNEFVNTPFNDVFAFFVNGVNCATVDPAHQSPVTINTINDGGPVQGQPPKSHPELYVNNDHAPFARNTEMDGLTKVLTCQAAVTPFQVNHLKVAIADATDPSYDSNVFIAAGSFTTTPPLTIIKRTNGTDNDTGTGPYVLIRRNAQTTVNWTYDVTNNSVVDTLSAVTVTDDMGVNVSCPSTTLLPGGTMRCTGTGVAVEGQYSNIGTARGTSAIFGTVGASNPDHYFGARPELSIVTKTNFTDNDVAPGPSILVDSTVMWTYEVSNTGNVPLANLVVTDSQGVPINCSLLPGGLPKTTLLVAETLICNATGPVKPGQYENLGSATATPPGGLDDVTASNVDHYFGVDPRLKVITRTNGTDNNTTPGLYVLVGSPVAWTYEVSNVGNVALSDVAVTDSRNVAISCPQTSLSIGTSMTCTANGTSVAGQYDNVGSATAPYGPVNVEGAMQTVNVTASDPDHYFGADPKVSIVKKTNGTDNDATNGPYILVGGAITWTYEVVNTGNVPLSAVVITDDKVTTVTCPAVTLDVAATMKCQATGTASAGQYANTGSVNATFGPVSINGRMDSVAVSATNVEHYFGADPKISLIKKTNTIDGDTTPGTFVLVGDEVKWTFSLTNTGNVTLTDITVADDQLGDICSLPSLEVGASTSCAKSGIAAKAQHENTATATATAPVGPPVTSRNADHYFGAEPKMAIVKTTNGSDNNALPGLPILVGTTVTWTYAVTNSGNVPLANVAVEDDKAGAICTIATLAAGATTSCAKAAPATKGTYQNTGTAAATFETTLGDGSIKRTALTAADVEFYFGADPKLTIAKTTVAVDRKVPNDDPPSGGSDLHTTAPGGIVLVGTPVTWSYTVTNAGNVPLTGLVVTDDKEGAICTIATLAVGQTAAPCIKTGTARLGQYQNTALVATTYGPVSVGPRMDTVDVTASATSSYFGASPSMTIVKKTNGTDNDTGTGPMILTGKLVTWTYEVTNTGNLPLANVLVTDDKIGSIACPAATLTVAPAAGSTMTCTKTAKATEGQYENLGSASGVSVLGTVRAANKDRYFGISSSAMFVIGDMQPHRVGDDVNFWGAQWWKYNRLSGPTTPGFESFKGFALRADVSSPSGCGGTWATRPGNSPPPPDRIGEYVAVIVTDTVSKSGPEIAGRIREIVVVRQDGGYSSNPGHRGSGPVIAVMCSGR